jgi:hypothetical protein
MRTAKKNQTDENNNWTEENNKHVSDITHPIS